MSNLTYVGIAYGLTYVVLAAYTIYLLRRRASVEEQNPEI